MRAFHFNKQKIGLIFVLIILLNTVSGYPTREASTLLEQRKPRKPNKRSAGVKVLGGQTEVMRLGLGSKDDGNQSELKISDIAAAEFGKTDMVGKSGQLDDANSNPAPNTKRREGRAMAKNIESRVKKVINEQLDISESDYGLDSSLVEDLGADSLGLVELILALEQEFEIDIQDEDAEQLKTVRQIINYVKKHAKN